MPNDVNDPAVLEALGVLSNMQNVEAIGSFFRNGGLRAAIAAERALSSSESPRVALPETKGSAFNASYQCSVDEGRFPVCHSSENPSNNNQSDFASTMISSALTAILCAVAPLAVESALVKSGLVSQKNASRAKMLTHAVLIFATGSVVSTAVSGAVTVGVLKAGYSESTARTAGRITAAIANVGLTPTGLAAGALNYGISLVGSWARKNVVSAITQTDHPSLVAR